MMNEDDIRGLNCDFNYSNYGVFYERLEEEQNGGNKAADEAAPEEGKEAGGKDDKNNENGNKANNLVGFQKIISE